eukprot:scaffold6560_cov60-Phaeocystis_antarctica.AAC.1
MGARTPLRSLPPRLVRVGVGLGVGLGVQRVRVGIRASHRTVASRTRTAARLSSSLERLGVSSHDGERAWERATLTRDHRGPSPHAGPPELLVQAADDLVAVRRVPQRDDLLHLPLHLRLGSGSGSGLGFPSAPRSRAAPPPPHRHAGPGRAG